MRDGGTWGAPKKGLVTKPAVTFGSKINEKGMINIVIIIIIIIIII